MHDADLALAQHRESTYVIELDEGCIFDSPDPPLDKLIHPYVGLHCPELKKSAVKVLRRPRWEASFLSPWFGC